MPNPIRVPQRYDAAFGAALAQRVLALEALAFAKGADVEIAAIPNPALGNRVPRLILRSPNGTRYSILVDNAGVLSTVAV